MKKGHKLYDQLQSQLPDDVILEDRLNLSTVLESEAVERTMSKLVALSSSS